MKRHNRILAVVLALIMILGTVPSFAANEVKEVIASKPTFADMPTEDHWSYAALKTSNGKVRVVADDNARVDVVYIADGKDDILIEGTYKEVAVEKWDCRPKYFLSTF